MEICIQDIEEIIKTYNMGFIAKKEASSQIAVRSDDFLKTLAKKYDEIHVWMTVEKPFILLSEKNNEGQALLINQFIDNHPLSQCNGVEFYKWFLDQESKTLKYYQNSMSTNEKQSSI